MTLGPNHANTTDALINARETSHEHAGTLHRSPRQNVKHMIQSTINRYMTSHKPSMVHDSEGFNTWFLSIDKVSKITGHDHTEICFAKAKGNS